MSGNKRYKNLDCFAPLAMTIERAPWIASYLAMTMKTDVVKCIPDRIAV
ncbi:MAG: hypothetical protein LBS88_12400 [Tannerellaceae bacterium]|nr:hypothetical protein [Tannerellaceae bacterium]